MRRRRERERRSEAVSWPGVASLSSLSFHSLSSSSDSVWCETLKSFNYQQLLGIHWMHEKWEEKKREGIRMRGREWGKERVFDVAHSSAHKTEQHFDCSSKGAHHLERSSVAVLWMGSSAFRLTTIQKHGAMVMLSLRRSLSPSACFLVVVRLAL